MNFKTLIKNNIYNFKIQNYNGSIRLKCEEEDEWNYVFYKKDNLLFQLINFNINLYNIDNYLFIKKQFEIVLIKDCKDKKIISEFNKYFHLFKHNIDIYYCCNNLDKYSSILKFNIYLFNNKLQKLYTVFQIDNNKKLNKQDLSIIKNFDNINRTLFIHDYYTIKFNKLNTLKYFIIDIGFYHLIIEENKGSCSFFLSSYCVDDKTYYKIQESGCVNIKILSNIVNLISVKNIITKTKFDFVFKIDTFIAYAKVYGEVDDDISVKINRMC